MREPGAQHRRREGEDLIVLDRVDLDRGGGPVAALEGIGEEQEAAVEQRRMAPFERPRGAEREPPVAGGDRMAERLAGDQLVVRRGGERRAEAARGPVELAVRSGGAGLDIGVQRISFVGARGRARRGAERGGGKQGPRGKLTCWDNWGLLRLRGPPS
ncbi:MAG TPA: hypothetical protein VLK25_11640 [Allosphingosinicella sp.]|nr:hypothetical protein [Allosphingosinicella sp.]